MATFKIPILLLIKSWTFWYIERLPLRNNIQELYTFKIGPVFWLILYSAERTLQMAVWCGCSNYPRFGHAATSITRSSRKWSKLKPKTGSKNSTPVACSFTFGYCLTGLSSVVITAWSAARRYVPTPEPSQYAGTWCFSARWILFPTSN